MNEWISPALADDTLLMTRHSKALTAVIYNTTLSTKFWQILNKYMPEFCLNLENFIRTFENQMGTNRLTNLESLSHTKQHEQYKDR